MGHGFYMVGDLVQGPFEGLKTVLTSKELKLELETKGIKSHIILVCNNDYCFGIFTLNSNPSLFDLKSVVEYFASSNILKYIIPCT